MRGGKSLFVHPGAAASTLTNPRTHTQTSHGLSFTHRRNVYAQVKMHLEHPYIHSNLNSSNAVACTFRCVQLRKVEYYGLSLGVIGRP